MIRSSAKKEDEEEYFIIFLQCIKAIKKIQEEHGLKKFGYEDVKRSKVFFNL